MGESKNIYSASTKHFSKFAENYVVYELSKWGWSSFVPYMDEYIDILATKIVCENCEELWVKGSDTPGSSSEKRTLNLDPIRVCGEDSTEVTKNQRSKITVKSVCENSECSGKNPKIFDKNTSKCTSCKKALIRRAYLGDKLVSLEDPSCHKCGHNKHKTLTRKIQIKSSREEVSNPQSYGFNFKLKDIFYGKNDDEYFLFLITFSREEEFKINILHVEDYMKLFNTEGISYLKDQPREHAKQDKFKLFEENWDYFETKINKKTN